jgi:mannose-6-phosphate isomerase-like protein (cupin superfamily)
MNIKNAQAVKAVESAHGEVVAEVIGNTAGGSQTYSLAQIVLPPGKASRKHYHPVAEEGYYILSGLARLELDGVTATMGPGDSAAIPPEKVHQIFNDGDEALIFLAICVPAWTPDNSIYLD